MPPPRRKRAWPTDTYAQRWARMLDLACILYAPPTIFYTLLEHVFHVH
jgi:hypothetical protein